ncbi:site-2 protease family protein [Bacillus massiliigorillae]|uniref:site-2 protease family protein n=1 Tax=Bacillus massiliigorillae TaxID=1243664 RepID=UPI000399F163|nr:site-2 protease family protein [Bacillus massiliigorillae]
MNKYFKLINKVTVHPTTWLVVGIAVITAHFQALLMLLTVVFVHEMGHACAAVYYKWRIKSIKILPFGGVLETDEYGNRTLMEDLHVTIFGPLQHLWMFLLSYVLLLIGVIEHETFVTFTYINSTICLFNLLPVWPLDGGKLLFLLLSLRYSFIQSHRLALQVSVGASIILLLAFIAFGQFSLNIVIILAFILFSISIEWRQRQYVFMRFLLERHYGKNQDLLKLKPITVDENEQVNHVLQLFQRGYKHPIIVTKDGKERGSLDENEILHAYFTDKLTAIKIGDLLYQY